MDMAVWRRVGCTRDNGLVSSVSTVDTIPEARTSAQTSTTDSENLERAKGFEPSTPTLATS